MSAQPVQPPADQYVQDASSELERSQTSLDQAEAQQAEAKAALASASTDASKKKSTADSLGAQETQADAAAKRAKTALDNARSELSRLTKEAKAAKTDLTAKTKAKATADAAKTKADKASSAADAAKARAVAALSNSATELAKEIGGLPIKITLKPSTSQFNLFLESPLPRAADEGMAIFSGTKYVGALRSRADSGAYTLDVNITGRFTPSLPVYLVPMKRVTVRVVQRLNRTGAKAWGGRVVQVKANGTTSQFPEGLPKGSSVYYQGQSVGVVDKFDRAGNFGLKEIPSEANDLFDGSTRSSSFSFTSSSASSGFGATSFFPSAQQQSTSSGGGLMGSDLVVAQISTQFKGWLAAQTEVEAKSNSAASAERAQITAKNRAEQAAKAMVAANSKYDAAQKAAASAEPAVPRAQAASKKAQTTLASAKQKASKARSEYAKAQARLETSRKAEEAASNEVSQLTPVVEDNKKKLADAQLLQSAQSQSPEGAAVAIVKDAPGASGSIQTVSTTALRAGVAVGSPTLIGKQIIGYVTTATSQGGASVSIRLTTTPPRPAKKNEVVSIHLPTPDGVAMVEWDGRPPINAGLPKPSTSQFEIFLNAPIPRAAPLGTAVYSGIKYVGALTSQASAGATTLNVSITGQLSSLPLPIYLVPLKRITVRVVQKLTRSGAKAFGGRVVQVKENGTTSQFPEVFPKGSSVFYQGQSVGVVDKMDGAGNFGLKEIPAEAFELMDRGDTSNTMATTTRNQSASFFSSTQQSSAGGGGLMGADLIVAEVSGKFENWLQQQAKAEADAKAKAEAEARARAQAEADARDAQNRADRDARRQASAAAQAEARAQQADAAAQGRANIASSIAASEAQAQAQAAAARARQAQAVAEARGAQLGRLAGDARSDAGAGTIAPPSTAFQAAMVVCALTITHLIASGGPLSGQKRNRLAEASLALLTMSALVRWVQQGV